MKVNAPEKIYMPTLLAANAVGFKVDGGIEYTRTDAFLKKAKVEFCKAICNDKPHRITCISLDACKLCDEFIKAMKGE